MNISTRAIYWSLLAAWEAACVVLLFAVWKFWTYPHLAALWSGQAR